MEIAASILSKDDPLINLKKLNETSVDYIHFDVMDGKFVKNKFLTPLELVSLLKMTNKKKDIHLMVNDPVKYIDKICLFDIDYITIHYEVDNYQKYIDLIKNYGIKVGISIKPKTNVEEIFPILDKINLVLVMSVEPGKSGQSFLKSTEKKIVTLKNEIKKRNLSVKIEVDGGINDETLELVKEADILVSSSFILRDLNNINILKGE